MTYENVSPQAIADIVENSHQVQEMITAIHHGTEVIVQLRTQNAELREALTDIANSADGWPAGTLRLVARAALAKAEGKQE